MRLSHDRHSLRLQSYDYSQPGAYFITICTYEKKNLLGNIVDGEMNLTEAGRTIWDIWESLPKRYPEIQLDAFVVMPNHIHGIIMVLYNSEVGAIHELPLPRTRIQRRRMLLPKVVGYFKMNTAKQVNVIRDTRGTPVWQRNYYEHIIRNEDQLQRLREYIINNPVRWHEDPDNPSNPP